MAFHNLNAATAGGEEGLVDVTHRAFEPVMRDLLPRGAVWDREDPVLRDLVAGDATELSRVDRSCRNLLAELDPHTTFDCIEDWELSYGLPECAAPDTLEARRAAVLAKLLAQAGHDQSLQYWTDLLKELGYELHFVLKGKKVMTCLGDCMDELFTDPWEAVWELAVAHGLDDALLECTVAHNALIETVPIVHYLWDAVDPEYTVDLFGVATTNNGYTAAVGKNGKILYCDGPIDAAGSWHQAPLQAEDMFAVCAVNTVLLAAGINPVNMIRSVDGGAHWTSTPIASDELYGLSRGYLGNDVAVAVGENGRIWRTADAGLSWIEMVSPTASVLNAVTRCQGALVGVGESGAVVRSTNNGTTWSLVAGISDHLYGVAGWLQVVIAVGANGKIWRSANAGANWSLQASPTTTTLRCVTGSPSGRWVAAGDGGVIVQSLDGGVTWSLQASPTTSPIRGANYHIPSGRALLVGDNTKIIPE